MSLLQRIQSVFFERYLNDLKRQNRNNSKSLSFDAMQTVGILFEATNVDERGIVFQYADELRARGKKVKLLGFFDNTVDDPNFTFRYFNRKNLDWALRPTGENVKEFIEQPFDLLITLDPVSKDYAEYIAATSKAHLRVGPITERTFCYDLMMDTGARRDLRNFIQHMESVLEKTNTRHEKATL